MENPPPRSLPTEIIEDEKLSLSDIEQEDEATLCEDDSAHLVATPNVVFANPLVELKGIDVVISDPVADEKNPKE